MTMMAPRESWTDNRMDDLVERIDGQFERLHADNLETRQLVMQANAEMRRENKALAKEIGEKNEALAKELREENKELAREFREENKELAAEFRDENKALAKEFREGLRLHREQTDRSLEAFTRRFDILQGVLITALVALIGVLLSPHLG